VIKIHLCSVYVNDQERALRFYTDALGFVLVTDVPAGDARWITVASPLDPGGVQLLLEPLGFAPAAIYQAALHEAGIPFTAFSSDDLQQEYERLSSLGVVFTLPPTVQPWGVMAVFDDTCGNLIMLQQMAAAASDSSPTR
jgi:catechol 2,3-dioxygenase-like lactoylglutathione lyase family enzyme